MTMVVPAEAGFWLDEYDAERFWSNVDQRGGIQHADDPLSKADGECWTWRGAESGSRYGWFRLAGKPFLPHRVAFVDAGGDLYDGAVVDHLCRNHRCVRPSHLEAISQAENVRRGRVLLRNRETCRNGHPVTEANIIVRVMRGKNVDACRICVKASKRRTYERARAKNANP